MLKALRIFMGVCLVQAVFAGAIRAAEPVAVVTDIRLPGDLTINNAPIYWTSNTTFLFAARTGQGVRSQSYLFEFTLGKGPAKKVPITHLNEYCYNIDEKKLFWFSYSKIVRGFWGWKYDIEISYSINDGEVVTYRKKIPINDNPKDDLDFNPFDCEFNDIDIYNNKDVRKITPSDKIKQLGHGLGFVTWDYNNKGMYMYYIFPLDEGIYKSPVASISHLNYSVYLKKYVFVANWYLDPNKGFAGHPEFKAAVAEFQRTRCLKYWTMDHRYKFTTMCVPSLVDLGPRGLPDIKVFPLKAGSFVIDRAGYWEGPNHLRLIGGRVRSDAPLNQFTPLADSNSGTGLYAISQPVSPDGCNLILKRTQKKGGSGDAGGGSPEYVYGLARVSVCPDP